MDVIHVAAAGSWMNSLTLRKVYQQSDAETMLHVALSGGETREKAGMRLLVLAHNSAYHRMEVNTTV